MTQVQCDEGKQPCKGFSIDEIDGKTLLYNGSYKFYACPATDYEYNIYISPDFGQAECVPIELHKDDCKGRVPHCPNPTEYWQGLFI
jgi:hypothetical protein